MGTQIGVTIDRPNVALAQGRFTQELDFGAAAFGPDARFLQIDVRSPAGSGSYVTLSPRQRVTTAPVAQFALVVGIAKIGDRLLAELRAELAEERQHVVVNDRGPRAAEITQRRGQHIRHAEETRDKRQRNMSQGRRRDRARPPRDFSAGWSTAGTKRS